MKNFKDQVVVITGAGSGMGRAYALEFAGLGARVALNDVDAHGLQETLDLLQATGTPAAHSKVYDVSDRDATYAFAAEVQDQLGGAHLVINNAGVEGTVKPVWATEDNAYQRVMAINYYGVVHGTRAFLPQLLANAHHTGRAAIVNVSSIFGLVGTPNHADYCASKFAVRGFTEALMIELQGTPVSVHLVHPGGIATNITRLPGSQAFAQRYLATSPEAIARHVVKSLRRGRTRIVYGTGSRKTWLGARLVPQRLLNRLIWNDVKSVIDLSDYPATGDRP